MCISERLSKTVISSSLNDNDETNNNQAEKNVNFSLDDCISHLDNFLYEDREGLHCSSQDLKSYRRNIRKTLDFLRKNDGDETAIHPTEQCLRGLEAYYEDTLISRKVVRKHYQKITLQLEKEFEKKGSTASSEKKLKDLQAVLETLGKREISRSARRAKQDEYDARSYHKEKSLSAVYTIPIGKIDSVEQGKAQFSSPVRNTATGPAPLQRVACVARSA